MNILTKNQNGFTLVELLIALVIFAVGILGVATMQITSIQGNSKGRQISEASNVGADRIETFLSLDYTDPLLADGDGDGTGQDSDGDGIDDDDGAGSTDDDNFGLDHATTATADGAADSDGDGTDDIFWNIAVDHPLPNTKTIKFIVDPSGTSRNVEMIYIKADII